MAARRPSRVFSSKAMTPRRARAGRLLAYRRTSSMRALRRFWIRSTTSSCATTLAWAERFSGSPARDRSDDEKRLRPPHDIVRQRCIRAVVRQIALAREKAQERPALLRVVIADRA